MRTYKPTLVQAMQIITAEGGSSAQEIYQTFQSIPTSEYEFLNFTLEGYGIDIDEGMIKISEIDIPFVDKPVSIQVPIGALWPS